MTTTATAKSHYLCPFRVVVDTAEEQPFTFQGLTADADHDHRPLIVETVRRCLGRHPDSRGDYSLEEGDEGWTGIGSCHVERKSMEDCQGTILGFGDGRRARFESELKNLQCVADDGGASLVVVECDWCELLNSAPAFGVRTAQQNAKTLARSVLRMIRKYRVPWMFAGSRRMAEIVTFRFLEQFWNHKDEGKDA